MLPPPPIQKTVQKEEENVVQNDISTIQSEVEKKLELQKESNRDVMETITVIASSRINSRISQHLLPSKRSKASISMIQSPKCTLLYLNSLWDANFQRHGPITVTRRLSLFSIWRVGRLFAVLQTVDLARLENKLLFCYDSEIEKKLNEFNASFNVQKSISALASMEQAGKEGVEEKEKWVVCCRQYRRENNWEI